MTTMLSFFLLAVAGALSIAASVSTIRVMSRLSRRTDSADTPKTPTIDLGDQYEVRAESVFLPTNGDWGESIQRQLDKIEDRDATAELVSVAPASNRLVLFYKVRKQK